jgi:hypothetical protein
MLRTIIILPVGVAVGDVIGVAVGITVGDGVGIDVGMEVGSTVGITDEGSCVGDVEGASEARVGTAEGTYVMMIMFS